MPDFMPGLELSRAFYEEAMGPVLAAAHPDLEYAAALLGPGSDVQGFDDMTSTDHSWGPHVDIYLREEDHERLASAILDALAQSLPATIRGYSTSFERIPGEPRAIRPRLVEEGAVAPFIDVTTVGAFVRKQLGVAHDAQPDTLDWLTIPEQHLRTIVGGEVFRDDVGELTTTREKLAYYPDDVWRYLLASQWQRIGQEEPFVGRTGSVGDDIGSAVLAARLVRDVMRLAFLLERTYAPYPKWFGTAFQQLGAADELAPHLQRALRATDWRGREKNLSPAYEAMARRTNDLDIAPPVPTEVSPFYGRPFLVIHADLIAEAIRATITDEGLRRLPLIGGVDQWSDSTDVLSYPQRVRRLRAMYEAYP